MNTDVADILMQLIEIRSVSGNTDKAISLVREHLLKLGLNNMRKTNKGALLATIPGTTDEAVILVAHVDTLGAMVSYITEEGTLLFRMVGGYTMNSIEGEYCTIETYDNRYYTGTILFSETSVHAYGRDRASASRTIENMYVRLDEKISSRKDVEKLGITAGNFIHFDTRPVMTESGYIKSRHIDDKAGVAILIAAAGKLMERTPVRTVHLLFTVHEELGHGGAGYIPDGVTELIAVDIGIVGEERESNEQKVTICAADNCGPYNYELTKHLVNLAEANGIPFVLDTFPYYTSDAAAALKSGLDARHALIGPGVDASHSMERTHIDGVRAALDLITAYSTE